MIKSLINNKQELEDLYIAQGKSLTQIGDICGVAFQTVYKWLKKNNIPLRDFSTKGFKFPGRHVSPELKKRLSELHTGMRLKEETKLKISKTLKELGLKAGPKSNWWKGGRYKIQHGYVMVWDPKRRHIKEHRLVVEKHIGRELLSCEHVHHINGVKDDNRIENLQIVSNSEHQHIHWSDPVMKKWQSERVKKLRATRFWSTRKRV